MSQVSNGHRNDFGDAEAHMRLAHQLLEGEDWIGGAEELQIAADLHLRGGRAYDEARCLQMAATALRASGDVAGARKLADQAAAISHGDPRLSLSIVTEQAEGAIEDGDYEAALPLIGRAIGLASPARLKPDGTNALLRRRARVHLALGNVIAAGQDYDRAYALTPLDIAGFVRTEQARALVEEGLVDEVGVVLNSLVDRTDPHLAAEIDVVRTKILALAQNWVEAIELAESARQLALEAVAPVVYFDASVELAEALQSLGRFSKSYGAMARAWATLGDLLGPEIASAWVEPCLVGFQVRWGEAEFAAAKQEYEAKRRIAKEIL